MNTNHPVLSVIVPTYKPLTFNLLISSMAANSDVDAEWIVVDDASGDCYREVFSILDNTPAQIVRLSENGRQAVARNVGLALAKGQFIKFLDADDELDEGHLAALLKKADEPAQRIPFAPTRHVYADGATLDNLSWRDLAATADVQLERLIHRPFLHHCGALFPRDLLTRIGGYDENLITDEDGDLLIRVLQSGWHFTPVPDVRYLYHHDVGTSRVSTDIGLEKLQARLRVCDKFEASFVEQGIDMSSTLKHALALRLDKIALAYWDSDRASARQVLSRAQRVFPGYRAERSAIRNLIRRFGGPSAMVCAARLYRKLRGRPVGGTQG